MNRRSIAILLALVLGLAAGALVDDNMATGLLAATRPIARLWLDALTMTVVPLVFALVVTGIAGAADSANAGRAAPLALAWFAGLLVGFCLLAAAFTATALQIWPVPAGARLLQGPAAAMPLAPAMDWFAGIIPTNPIKAAADTAMVPLVVFALAMGFAAARIAPASRDALLGAVRGLGETMLVIVGWVLWLAPVGVFALAFGVGATAGLGAAGVLVHYLAIIIATCIAATLLAVGLAVIAGRMSPMAFVRAALPAQIVAMSTQSSLAALPAMVDSATALGVSRDSAGVVLPLAVSVFRAASAAANVAVAIYLAAVHGIALDAGLLVMGALVAAAVSVAAVGLPAQVSFFAVVGPVCLAMGVPTALLALLLAIETLPDMFRTLGNVTADLAVTRIVGRRLPRLVAVAPDVDVVKALRRHANG